MPVYHLVLHSYGSWLPDQPEGYHDRKHEGNLSANPALGKIYRDQMNNPRMEFTPAQRQLILHSFQNTANPTNWRLHAIAVVPTHIHMLISWKSQEHPSRIQGQVKQYLTYLLNKSKGQLKGQWFSRGGGMIKIRDMDHLHELRARYIPGHGNDSWIDPKLDV